MLGRKGARAFTLTPVHTQEVIGSSPVGPIFKINSLGRYGTALFFALASLGNSRGNNSRLLAEQEIS